MNNKEIKILCFDIETAPTKAFIWGLWQEVRSMDFIIEDWYILCWSAKWLGKKKILSASLPESSSYKKHPENDKEIMVKLRDLLDEADIVVAHNAVKFDCKKVNARFIFHDINPPSPYKVVDTLKIARQHFAFTSNRLDSLGETLKLGRKMKHQGFQLWKDCLNGCEKAWKIMTKYCNQDVKLLEKVYFKLRPYMKTHPNLGVLVGEDRPLCPKCASTKIHYQGYAMTNAGKYRKFQCQNCGGWGREKQNILEKGQRQVLTTNIT